MSLEVLKITKVWFWSAPGSRLLSFLLFSVWESGESLSILISGVSVPPPLSTLARYWPPHPLLHTVKHWTVGRPGDIRQVHSFSFVILKTSGGRKSLHDNSETRLLSGYTTYVPTSDYLLEGGYLMLPYNRKQWRIRTGG